MSERKFAKKCGNCRQRAMALTTIPYEIQFDHDGRKYGVTIPALTVPRCGNCGEISIDHDAEAAIDEAFRRVAKLLDAKTIREGREYFGYTQQQFADTLGVAATTISRWETGAQVQQRFHDGILRAFFQLPELRSFLEEFHGTTGSSEVRKEAKPHGFDPCQSV